MKVYRYLCEEEYNNIINSNLDKLGHNYHGKGLSNTFNYKDGERYLHFFKDKKAIKEIRKIYRNDGKDYYTCTFNIPLLTLLKGMGKGYYETSGYDTFYQTEREFILNVKDFKPEYLIDAEFDKDKHDDNLLKKEIEESGIELY